MLRTLLGPSIALIFTAILLLTCDAGAWTYSLSGSCPGCGSPFDGDSARTLAIVPPAHPAGGAGDVVVGGWLRRPLPQIGDAVVARLSSGAGVELWRTEIEGEVWSSTLDGHGGLLVAGLLVGLPYNTSIMRVDLAAGDIVWRAGEFTGNSDAPGGNANWVAADANGNAIVAGSSVGHSIGVFAYDGATGVRLWKRILDLPSPSFTVSALAVDGAGDVFLLGTGTVGQVGSYVFVKLDGSDGTELWRVLDSSRYGTGLALAGDGAPLVGSYSFVQGPGGGCVDTRLTKRSPATGSVVWEKVSLGSCASSVIVGPGGEVIFDGGGLTRIDPSTGAEIWRDTSVGVLGPLDLDVGPSGQVLRASASGTASLHAAADGSALWQAAPIYVRFAVALDPAGDAVLGGILDEGGGSAGSLGVAKVSGIDGSDFLETACPNGVVEAVAGEGCDDGNASSGDGCSASCALENGWACPGHGLACEPVCGDGQQVGSEVDAGRCDDGNLVAGDGCDAACRVELIVPPTEVPPGQSASTGSEATPAAPVQATVTTPTGGTTAIVVTSVTQPTPTGYEVVGRQVNITAPPATDPSAPLVFVFRIEASLVPGGDLDNLRIFRNGVPVADCIGATSALANGSPCVSRRQAVGDDVEIEVLTLAASTWTLATPLALDDAEKECRKAVRQGVARAFAGVLGARQKCIDRVNAGKQSEPCPDYKTARSMSRAASGIGRDKIAKACSDPAIAGMPKGAACAAAVSSGQLAECLASEIESAVASLLETEYATADANLGDVANAKCQARVAKAAGQGLAAARVKSMAKCQVALDDGKTMGCPDFKALVKLVKGSEGLATAMSRVCTDTIVGDLAMEGFGGSCSTAATVADLAACQRVDHEALADALIQLLP